MMRRIEFVMDQYTSEVMEADRLVQLREEDLAIDAAHQAFVRARYAWKVSTLSREDWFEERETWAQKKARPEDDGPNKKYVSL